MKPSCRKQRINILDYFAIPNVTVDDNVVPDFYITRQQTHDGTLYFTQQVYKEIVELLANSQSYKKSNEPDWERLDHTNYTVGLLRIATVFGNVLKLGDSDHKYPGQRERFRLAIKCEHVYK